MGTEDRIREPKAGFLKPEADVEASGLDDVALGSAWRKERNWELSIVDLSRFSMDDSEGINFVPDREEGNLRSMQRSL